MNDVCATVGLSNLKHIQVIIDKHKENALYYNKELKHVKNVELFNNDKNESSYWVYTLKVNKQKKFIEMMKNKGIIVSRIHERNDKHSCVKEYKTKLPNIDNLVNNMICIPVY